MIHEHEDPICLIRHGETDWNANAASRARSTYRSMPRAGARLPQPGAPGDEDFAAATAATQAALATAGAALTRQPILAEQGCASGIMASSSRSPWRRRRRATRSYRQYLERDLHYDLDGARAWTASRRAMAGLRRWLSARGQTVLVVTHGGVLDVVYRRASGRSLESPRDFPLPNAAFNWLERTPLAGASSAGRPASLNGAKTNCRLSRMVVNRPLTTHCPPRHVFQENDPGKVDPELWQAFSPRIAARKTYRTDRLRELRLLCVLEAQGSQLTNKYAEAIRQALLRRLRIRRYREQLAIDRAKKLFGANMPTCSRTPLSGEPGGIFLRTRPATSSSHVTGHVATDPRRQREYFGQAFQGHHLRLDPAPRRSTTSRSCAGQEHQPKMIVAAPRPMR